MCGHTASWTVGLLELERKQGKMKYRLARFGSSYLSTFIRIQIQCGSTLVHTTGAIPMEIIVS